MTSSLETTRASYDTVAADYHKLLRDDLATNPFDRAALGLFAELVAAAGGGPVGDLGCGTGRITTYVAGLGLDVFGLDLSPEMLAVARSEYPELRFGVGDLLGLDLADDSLAGALAWYSLVHTPPEDLAVAFQEIHRVLRPGGVLVHAFKVGSDGYHLTEAYGHPLSLDVYCYEPAEVTTMLTSTGFVAVAALTHAARPQEKTPQGYLIARKVTP